MTRGSSLTGARISSPAVASFQGKRFRTPEVDYLPLLPDVRRLGVATMILPLQEPLARQCYAAGLTRVSGRECIAGRALTIWNPPGTSTMLQYGLELIEPDDVLTMQCETDGIAQIGDLACELLYARGGVGAVIEGAVRDAPTLRRRGFEVWARSINPGQGGKDWLGYVNAPISVGGAMVAPGDLVIADDDGVAFIPAAMVERCVEAALKREVREADLLALVRDGKPPGEFPNEDKVQRLDVTWDDDGTR